MADGYSQEDLDKINEKALLKELATVSPEPDERKDQLLDPLPDREHLKKVLYGKKEVWIRNNDGTYEKKQVDTSERQLINEKGFARIWSTIVSVVNQNTTGAYLSSSDIAKIGYQACAKITIQIYKKHDEYEVEDPEEFQQIVMGIIAPTIKASLSKARGGRGLQHTEQTVVKRVMEKIGGEDEGEGPLGRLL